LLNTICSGTCNILPASSRNSALMPSKPTDLLRLSFLITCVISSKVMSQFSVLQSSLAKGCDKLETTWSVELPCPPTILLGHCPSSNFWKPVTKFALLIATDHSLLLEYYLQKLAGSVFASAHNCRPCSFLYVRFLQRSSCLSCCFRSRARWLSRWSFAYANTSLCFCDIQYQTMVDDNVVLYWCVPQGSHAQLQRRYKCSHATTARPCQHCLCHSSVLCIGQSVAAGADIMFETTDVCMWFWSCWWHMLPR